MYFFLIFDLVGYYFSYFGTKTLKNLTVLSGPLITSFRSRSWSSWIYYFNYNEKSIQSKNIFHLYRICIYFERLYEWPFFYRISFYWSFYSKYFWAIVWIRPLIRAYHTSHRRKAYPHTECYWCVYSDNFKTFFSYQLTLFFC